MKCLTLTQPWATLVAIGAKRIETRSWSTNYRGPLAIHAARGLGPAGGKRRLIELVCSPPFAETLLKAFGRKLKIEQDLPRGAIVAVCFLKDVLPIDLPLDGRSWTNIDRRVNPSELTDQERAFGDFAPGRYALLLDDVRRLPEPIPCKGALGLWKPDTLTEMAIQRQMIAGVGA